jgi:hypothetical protein
VTLLSQRETAQKAKNVQDLEDFGIIVVVYTKKVVYLQPNKKRKKK